MHEMRWGINARYTHINLMWSKHQAGGRGVNAITDDRLADMGRGPALHSSLVQVARL